MVVVFRFQIRRYEFIRRSLTRGEKSTSPTFVIEGRKVIHKNQNGQGDVFPLPPESLSSIEDAKYDFDALAFLESRGALKSTKPVVPPRPKPDAQSGKAAGPCVVLPVLHIEGGWQPLNVILQEQNCIGQNIVAFIQGQLILTLYIK